MAVPITRRQWLALPHGSKMADNDAEHRFVRTREHGWKVVRFTGIKHAIDIGDIIS
jgi:hypothetical protein